MSTQDTTIGLAAVIAAPACEQELAIELRAGSTDAFNYLIALYHQPLYRFVARLANPDDAADIVQDVFLKAFRAAAGFEGKSSVKTWLYQIALHEASNHRRWWHRHKRRETSLEEPDDNGVTFANRLEAPNESPLSQTLRHEQQRQLQDALRQVPEPFHAVVVLREVEGFSYDEIAEIVQARIGTVKSRLLRGREMLRQAWLRDHAEASAAAGMGASRQSFGSVEHA
jgi:RNA polymerase sigma-70 factor (ECF subfamily)